MNVLTKMGLAIMGPELLSQNPDLYTKYYKEAGLNPNQGILASPVGSFQSTITAQMPKPPSLPAPPVNPQNPAEQQQYNQQLLEYNQLFQAYHVKMMSMLFTNMQRMLLQSSRQNQVVGNAQTTSSSSTSYSSSDEVSGSILG